MFHIKIQFHVQCKYSMEGFGMKCACAVLIAWLDPLPETSHTWVEVFPRCLVSTAAAMGCMTAWELAYYDNICGLWLPPVHLQKPHTWQQAEVRCFLCTTHHPPMAEHAQTATIEARESEPSQPRARMSGRAMSHPHTLRHRDTSSYLNELNSTETNRWSCMRNPGYHAYSNTNKATPIKWHVSSHLPAWIFFVVVVF